MSKIVKVYREKKFNRTFAVYSNSFPTARGRNVATVSGFPNWAVYDEDNNFSADFESVHGGNTWQPWLAALREVSEWTDNEVVQTVPELGGTEQ